MVYPLDLLKDDHGLGDEDWARGISLAAFDHIALAVDCGGSVYAIGAVAL